MRRFIVIFALLPALLPILAAAAPDLRHGRSVEGLTVYPDTQHDQRFYYAPGKVVVDSDADGRPGFHLLSTRFVGTAASGNQGLMDQRNMLTFRIRLQPHDRARLAAARESLQGGRRAAVDLRPLPIRRMPTRLIYTPVETEEAYALPQASLDGETGESQGYWTERSYSLRLGARDAQMLIDALERGGVILSVSYAFIADGVGMETGFDELTGSPELVEMIEAELEPDDEDGGIGPRLVAADTTTIAVDTARWPDLIRQIDINERLPPGFAVLDVRCYDFQREDQREDPRGLYEKRVDIRAQTVAGMPIVESLYFSRRQPERFADRVRFPVAVHLDRPYEYRVVSVFADGRVVIETDWTRRERWTALLDVTTTANAPDAAEPDFTDTGALSDLSPPEIK
ncbi:MAG: hypothetical protein WD397_13085 [Wenzhouxiangellaceae bacterium]